MRWSEDRILTTHTGSLPRPPELTRLYVQRARGGEVDPAELDRLVKEALRQIVDKQAAAGIDIGNNGEQQREAFFLYIRHRMSGFGSGWKRWPRGDVERYPLLKQQMAEALAAREAVSNMDPPKAVGEVRYIDEGPHDKDVPLEDILPILQKANVGGFVLPFANPRHQHEYRVLQKFPLADDQIIVAGVIDDLTGFVEHPEVVADRIENVARVVGDPKRVMAGTDCGFDTSAGMGRVTEDVVWAKMRAMADGARIASQRLGLH